MTDPARREKPLPRDPIIVHPERPRETVGPRGEVYEGPAHVVGTFHLPAHQPRDLKYHVGRRTITLWSRKEGHEFQTILVLPRWVNPNTFMLTHTNGVYEFVLEAAERDPEPAFGP